MKISECFKSKYLKAATLKGSTVRCEIESVTLEQMPDGEAEKPVVYFKGKDAGLILNRTNATMLEERFGDDCDQWPGHQIEITTERVSFQGRLVDGIRIRVPVATPSLDFEEDIAF